MIAPEPEKADAAGSQPLGNGEEALQFSMRLVQQAFSATLIHV
jgi:hypothetical protein